MAVQMIRTDPFKEATKNADLMLACLVKLKDLPEGADPYPFERDARVYARWAARHALNGMFAAEGDEADNGDPLSCVEFI